MNEDFLLESGGFELLPRIRALWYELKDHHSRLHPGFPDMSTPRFELRESGLKAKAADLLVDFVVHKSDGREAGYCLSAIHGSAMGEIESLYVREEFRGRGIGGELARRALCWMDEKHVKSKCVSVLSGNREAVAFYERFGFRPRVYEMMIPAGGGAPR